MLQVKRQDQITFLHSETLDHIPGLVHAFSTRRAERNDFSLGPADSPNPMIQMNRARFLAAIGAPGWPIIKLKQIHSGTVVDVDDTSAASEAVSGDAAVTALRGVVLAVQTADCVPILFVDPKKRVVAAVHAGWRGTLARIAQKTIGRMQLEFACKPADLLAALGPSIGPCCYEVGVELVTKFTAQFADAHDYFDEPRTGDEPNPIQWLNMAPPGHQPPPKNVRLDLRKANRSQLIASGLRPTNIYSTDLCTACRTDLLFSYRREGPLSGRLLAVVGIRSLR